MKKRMNSTKCLLITLLCCVHLLLASSEDAAVVLSNKATNDTKNNVIEIKKDVTVTTGTAFDIPLSRLTNTIVSNIVKSRKVTHVDAFGADKKGGEVEKKSVITPGANGTTTTTTTTLAPKIGRVGLQVAENIYINLTEPKASSTAPTVETNKDVKLTLTANNSDTNTAVVANKSNGIDDKALLNHADKNNIKSNDTAATNTTTKLTPPVAVSTTTKAAVVDTSGSATLDKSSTSAPTTTTNTTTPSNATSTTPSTTTAKITTTSTTTTTTTTTTPKPKKPTITYGVEDFPDLDKQNPAWNNLTQQQQETSSGKLPVQEAPYAQPSQEFSNNSFHGSQDYILPIISIIFIVIFVIGILITSYRRFRDCYATRHYRRMDFLVDGMYND